MLLALSGMAYAGGQIQTQVLYNVGEGRVSELPSFFFYGDAYPGTSNETPKAWVKDGQGTALLKSDVKMYNPLVVREGTFEINGANVSNYSKLNNGTSNLSVGGNNAHLVLDNANYSQKIEYAENYVSAIAIGTTDGAGKVTLKNGSSLHTDQFIFAGYKSIGAGYVTSTTVSQQDSSQYSNGIQGRSEINIESGSTLSAGTSLQFANVDINISGAGSELKDNTRGIHNENSYSWLGCAVDSETTINVTEGASLNIQHNLVTGYGKSSTTNISASGKDSTVKLAGISYLSSYSNGASTNLTLTEGAKAEVALVYAGNGTLITVGDGSSIVAHSSAFPEKDNSLLLYVEQGAKIANSGIIDLDITVDGGTYIGDGSADQFGGEVFTMLDGAVVEGLTMTSGTVSISGEVTLTNVTLGTIINPAGLAFYGSTEALTVYIEQGSIINADELNMGEGATIAVVLEEGVIYEEGTQLFTLTGASEEFVNEIASMTTVTWTEDGETKEAGFGTETGLHSGSISTAVVPEPTTATLSLLALCGLCARRRRK